MTRFVWRWGLLLLGLFTVGALLVRLQPPESPDVAELLISANCAAPCFMGIRPGETMAGEAVHLLETNDLVQNIEARYTDFGQSTNTFWGYVYWQWTDQSPLWRHEPTFKLGLHDAYLRILDGRVNEIAFSTSLPLGAAVLSLGRDGKYVLERPDRYGAPPYPLTHHFYYPAVGLVLGSIGLCPALNPDWYQDTVVMVWSAEYFGSFLAVNRAIGPSLADARQQARLICQ